MTIDRLPAVATQEEHMAENQELQRVSDAPPASPAPGVEPTSLLAIISRAAENPNFDPDKFDRLLAAQERVMAQRAKVAFSTAFAEMQGEMPTVEKNGRIIIRDKNNQERIIQSTPFALLEDIQVTVQPILQEHGFWISFRNGLTEDGRVTVTTILGHKDGHREETMFTLPHDSTGSKNNVQAIGSSTSYGKRYGLTSILNIPVRGEDDDGNSATDLITDEQVKDIRKQLDEVKADEKAFLGWLSNAAGFVIDGIEKIPVDKLEIAKTGIEGRRRALAAQAAKPQAEQLKADEPKQAPKNAKAKS